MTIVPFLFIFAATIILFFPGLLPETYTGQINLSPVDAGFILVPFLCSLPLFAFWLILFISVVKRILWLFGKEVFEVRGDMLTIHRVVLGIKRSQEYQASEIQNLRLYDRASDRSRKRTILNAYFANVLVNKGLIAFEHQGKTIRFANDVDEAEAKQILSKINRVIDLYHP